MSSLRRILASRANGRLSTGPSTEAAKSRSSQNALRHVVLDDESPAAFQSMMEQHLDRIRPADGLERNPHD